MSIQALNWAFKQQIFEKPTAKFILIALANYADAEGVCYPSQERLAEMCSVARRTVIRSLQYLEEIGCIERCHRRDKLGRQATDIFQLLVEGKKTVKLDDFQGEKPSENPSDNLSRWSNSQSDNCASQSDNSDHSSVTPCHSYTKEEPKEENLKKEPKGEVAASGKKKPEFSHPFEGTTAKKPIVLSAESEITKYLDLSASRIGAGTRENLPNPKRWRKVVEIAVKLQIDIPTWLSAVDQVYDRPPDQLQYSTPEQVLTAAQGTTKQNKKKSPVSTPEEKRARFAAQSRPAPFTITLQ